MKKLLIHICKYHLPILLLVNTLSYNFTIAQTPVTSIITSGYTASQVTYNNMRGAGLRYATGGLFSSWDTINTYTVNFNAPAARNNLRLDQFYVSGISAPFITMPLAGVSVKVRRNTNPDIGDNRVIYNFWAEHSSIPASGATSGTFNFTAQEVLRPEDSFLSNNLTSGFDNIFCNVIGFPHFANIERLDYIIPSGLKVITNNDLTESGVTIIDRGTGDQFKIAAILALDASQNPTLFGNLVSVEVANFGNNLLASNMNYGIMINDERNLNQSRPSTANSQNLRGVFISLQNLGLVVNQVFYGYALFGYDVTSANPDWTTYPTNSGGSILDPVNVMGMFKSVNSVLSVPTEFSAIKVKNCARLFFSFMNKTSADQIIVERSNDNVNFKEIGRLQVNASFNYIYNDDTPLKGKNFYRFRFAEQGGESNLSETRMLEFEETVSIKLFPNPIIDILQIRLPSNLLHQSLIAEILNFNGKQISQTRFINSKTIEEIKVGDLPKGIYQLRIYDNEQQGKIFSYRTQFLK